MRRCRRATGAGGLLFLLLPVLVPAADSVHHQHSAGATAGTASLAARVAPAPPLAHDYTLPKVKPAGNAHLIDANEQPQTLRELSRGKLLLLSFIFTHCADPKGCPLASFVMRQVGRAAAADPALKNRVRLLSFSFDPARDTPARLAAYRDALQAGALDWHFATVTNPDELPAVLSAYGQSVLRDPAGGNFSHQLRVFLIDGEGQIRNEYSTAFLRAPEVLADLRSVAHETDSPREEAETGALPTEPPRGAGDTRTGYASLDFRTQSRALTARHGQPLDLDLTRDVPLGLPTWPAAVPRPTRAQIDLGRQLFFDRRLSHNETLACASCHVPDQGFTHQELATPVGFEGRTVRRNAPALYNLPWVPRLFHDGRERSLEHQIWAPLLAANEMANPSIGHVLDKIAGLAPYPERFAAAFPGEGLSLATLGAAFAAYERTLLSARSAFDRARYGEEPNALPAEARRGLALFEGKAGCSRCHLVGKHNSLFTDDRFHDTGTGYARSMHGVSAQAIWSSPGQQLQLAPGAVNASSETAPNDLGRYEITRQPADRWKFRTPSLRNVAVTGPYMHDGSLASLDEVVAFYNRGGVPHEGLAAEITPLGLSQAEQESLVAFLQSLTGDNIAALAADAFSAPIGDRQQSAD